MQFDVPRLQSDVSSYLSANITLGNAFEVFEFARAHLTLTEKGNPLAIKSMEYVLGNFFHVSISPLSPPSPRLSSPPFFIIIIFFDIIVDIQRIPTINSFLKVPITPSPFATLHSHITRKSHTRHVYVIDTSLIVITQLHVIEGPSTK